MGATVLIALGFGREVPPAGLAGGKTVVRLGVDIQPRQLAM
jgi:hypothetical protein